MGKGKRDGFYKRGRFWWTRDPITGNRCSTGCTDFEAAKAWRAARELAKHSPDHGPAQTATLGEWVGKWLDMRQRKAAAATMSVARQKLGHWVRILGADYPLREINAGTVDSYVAKRRGEDVTDHTIVKEFSHMRAVLRLAKRSKAYLGELDELRPEDLHAGYEPRKRSLTRPELSALLSELEPHRAAMVAVCVALGCRLGEAQRLLPTDIDGGQVFIRGTKTKGARRHVPILSLYEPLLAAALPYLPLKRWDNVRRGLGRACKRAGIERCTPNDLRRTHATLLVEAGVDRDVIWRLLGHTGPAMLDRVYGKPKPEALGQLAEPKLLAAAPIPVHGGHSDDTDSELSVGASLGIRTPDLRFTKPYRDVPETPEKDVSGEKHSDSAPAGSAEDPGEQLATGTNKAHSVGAWALAETALRLGVLPAVSP